MMCAVSSPDSEMILEIRLLLGLLAVLTGSSQIRGQTSPPSPALTLAALQSHAGGSPAPRSNASWPEASEQTHHPALRNETSPGAASITKETPESERNAASSSATTTSAAVPPPPTNIMSALPGPQTSSASADALSSTLTLEPSTPPQLTPDPLATFSSPPVHTEQDAHVTTSAILSQPGLPTTVPSQPTTTEGPLTSATGRGPAGPTHREAPAQLNVGDEDIKPRYRSSSPLDPLLAGLLSVFIVTTAIVFITLFFRFRQRTNHPEFHRLQDLPMDDLMEDTPLSRYTY
ncbi:hypothetical protein fugu_014231 [Takifugu bimaculatus]|uniref:Uncharacterized protein n=1 Tax=Takifugu bimaculatus TaxID=433685 RepID=A0A4Z2C0M2_9TELE|nr:hypothetical protein fugu_014231 [Takifugu bimaculatus]